MRKRGKVNIIPIFICLLASFITCIMSIIQKVTFKSFVIRFVLVSLVFYFFGLIVRSIIISFFKENEKVKELKEENKDIETQNSNDSIVDADNDANTENNIANTEINEEENIKEETSE